jgi:hypothetical protein
LPCDGNANIEETLRFIGNFFSQRKTVPLGDGIPSPAALRGYLYVTQMLQMKALITLIVIFTVGASALAKNPTSHGKVHTVKMDIVLDLGTDRAHDQKEISTQPKDGLVRLYRTKNARVSKALTFSTKNDKAKLA